MWHGFTGEAIATLWGAVATGATGLLAVGGAIVVGLKQAGISRRQTEIMEAQGEIERKRVAHELYERRYAAYDAAAALLVDTVQGEKRYSTPAIRDRFITVMQESHFLFPREVYLMLNELWLKCNAYLALNQKMQEDYGYKMQYTDGDAQKILDLSIWIDERIKSLHLQFPQLVLY